MSSVNPTERADRSGEIGIVGAGIAGIALAIACTQAGLQVRLYDRRSAAEAGAHDLLELPANGARVLHALGLKAELAESALVPEFTTLRGAATGFLLGQRPLGAFSDARYGAPTYLIESDRLQVLLEQACNKAQIPIERAVTITGVETESGTLIHADGSRTSHQAIAVASGAPGHVGEISLADLLEQRHWQVDTDLTVIRARCKRSGNNRDHDRFINTWLMRGGYCVERPLHPDNEGKQQTELIAVINAPRPGLKPEQAIVELLTGCHHHLRSLLEGIFDAEYVQTPAAPVAEFWQAGQLALLGGACHAPAVESLLGPAAALEDAWILSRMMERWEDEPHQGFSEYARFRKPRARRLARFTSSQLQTLTLNQTRQIWLRNFNWSMTSRFLPEIVMQKLDWLYGYDCIKGFD